MAKTTSQPGEKVLVKNRRATFDFELAEHFEAGMVLMGSEVKSMRAGTVDLTDAWASIQPDGIYLKNVTIQPLPHGAFQHAPRRDRKLLLHASEIERIRRDVQQLKMTLIPLRIYIKNGIIKAEIALARGKKKEDKRQTIKEREAHREAFSAARRTVKH